jgi:hypothetical protein
MKEFFQRLGFTLLGIVVAFIPAWLYLLARVAFSPQGFWQNIVLFGFGVWILGAIQFILVIVLVFVLVAIWSK